MSACPSGGNGGRESVCPDCLSRIPAWYEEDGGEVFLTKECPVHGRFRTVVWRGDPAFSEWKRPKIPTTPQHCRTGRTDGCPFDCGLCPDHRQKTCSALIEVTSRCNLGCPVCFADAGRHSSPDPDLATIGSWYDSVLLASGQCNIQISGGEPTVRDDLPEIVALGRNKGFTFIQLNTNGLRLAAEPDLAERLKEAGLSSVFLQFDGLDDSVYGTLRGRPLFKEKIRALEVCREKNLGVVLVPTLKPGVNDHQIGAIIRLGLEYSPAVRGVHFQPISYFGRYPVTPADNARLTLPEIIRAVESQTGGLMKVQNFSPPGCENAYCSFHGNFVILPGGRLMSTTSPAGGSCCGTPEKAEEGADRAISSVSRRWRLPAEAEGETLQTPDCGCSLQEKLPDNGLMTLDSFLARARLNSFSVSAMAFQDAWNMDLERVRDCCIHIVIPDGRLVPFCACNLTSTQGRRLYRDR